MSAMDQPRDRKVRRAVSAAVVAPVRPWFNRWFTSLSEHVEQQGEDTRHLLREVRDQLGDERDLRVEESLARFYERLDTQLAALERISTEIVGRLEADLRAQNQHVTEAVLTTERQLARLQSSVADMADHLHGGETGELGVLESLEAVRTELKRVSDLGQPVAQTLEAVRGELEGIRRSGLARYVGAGLDELDDDATDAVSWITSRYGPLGQAGGWLDDGIERQLSGPTLRVGDVGSRIVEIPTVHRLLTEIPDARRLLVTGAADTVLPLQLATTGFDVTLVSAAPFLAGHDHLRVVPSVAAASEPCDAAILLALDPGSTGIDPVDGDGPARLDAVLDRVAGALAPGAPCIVRVDLGPSTGERLTLDGAGLDALVANRQLHAAALFERTAGSWQARELASGDGRWAAGSIGVGFLVVS